MITQIKKMITVIHLPNGPKGQRGQYALEVCILLAAVVVAATLMTKYVRGAMRANVKMTEMQLNGAMRDNRP